MTAPLLLLWRPAPTTDVLREAVASCSGFTVVEEQTTDDLAGGSRESGVLDPRNWSPLRRRRHRRLVCVAVDGELEGPRLPSLAHARSGPARRTRPVLLLPSARHQVEQLYREHVLAGGSATFDRFRTGHGLDDVVRSWREAMHLLVEEAGGRTVVATPDPDASVEALARAAAVDVDELRSLAGTPSGISSRGLEILRRMNTFTHDAAEQRRARRFCTRRFAAVAPDELDVPDTPWPTP